MGIEGLWSSYCGDLETSPTRLYLRQCDPQKSETACMSDSVYGYEGGTIRSLFRRVPRSMCTSILDRT